MLARESSNLIEYRASIREVRPAGEPGKAESGRSCGESRSLEPFVVDESPQDAPRERQARLIRFPHWCVHADDDTRVRREERFDTLQPVRRRNAVGVREAEDFSGRCGDPGFKRMFLRCRACGEFVHTDQPKRGKSAAVRLYYFSRAVIRPVINDDDLFRPTGLCPEGLEEHTYVVRFISGGNDHADISSTPFVAGRSSHKPDGQEEMK